MQDTTLAQEVDVFDSFQALHATDITILSVVARSSPDVYTHEKDDFTKLEHNLSKLATDFLAQARKDLGTSK